MKGNHSLKQGRPKRNVAIPSYEKDASDVKNRNKDNEHEGVRKIAMKKLKMRISELVSNKCSKSSSQFKTKLDEWSTITDNVSSSSNNRNFVSEKSVTNSNDEILVRNSEGKRGEYVSTLFVDDIDRYSTPSENHTMPIDMDIRFKEFEGKVNDCISDAYSCLIKEINDLNRNIMKSSIERAKDLETSIEDKINSTKLNIISTTNGHNTFAFPSGDTKTINEQDNSFIANSERIKETSFDYFEILKQDINVLIGNNYSRVVKEINDCNRRVVASAISNAKTQEEKFQAILEEFGVDIRNRLNESLIDIKKDAKVERNGIKVCTGVQQSVKEINAIDERIETIKREVELESETDVVERESKIDAQCVNINMSPINKSIDENCELQCNKEMQMNFYNIPTVSIEDFSRGEHSYALGKIEKIKQQLSGMREKISLKLSTNRMDKSLQDVHQPINIKQEFDSILDLSLTTC